LKKTNLGAFGNRLILVTFELLKIGQKSRTHTQTVWISTLGNVRKI